MYGWMGNNHCYGLTGLWLGEVWRGRNDVRILYSVEVVRCCCLCSLTHYLPTAPPSGCTLLLDWIGLLWYVCMYVFPRLAELTLKEEDMYCSHWRRLYLLLSRNIRRGIILSSHEADFALMESPGLVSGPLTWRWMRWGQRLTGRVDKGRFAGDFAPHHGYTTSFFDWGTLFMRLVVGLMEM